MNSYPRIESLLEISEQDAGETFIFPVNDEEEDCQQVNSLRIARLPRSQARCEGALSETPRRVGDKA